MVQRIAVSFFLLLTISSAPTGCTTLLFYHPTRQIYADPAVMGFPYENLRLPSYDGTMLHGVWIHRARSSKDLRTVVLFFHGNGENLSSHFMAVAWLANLGYDLLIYDYRGYGLSEGEIDHDDINEDSLAMVRGGAEMARARKMAFVVFGQSMGGILASSALLDWKDRHPDEYRERHPRLLVLDSTFASYRNIARDKLTGGCLPLLKPLVPLFVAEDHAVQSRLARLSPIPLIVVHGEDDDIVPVEFGRAVYAAAGEPRRLLIIPGAGHGSGLGLGRSAAARDLAEAMADLLKVEEAPDGRGCDGRTDAPSSMVLPGRDAGR